MTSRSRLALLIATLTGGLAALSLRCASSDGPATVTLGVGGSGNAGASGLAGISAGGGAGQGGINPWGTDVFPKEGQAAITHVPSTPTGLSCGPGCRIAMPLPTDHPGYYASGISTAGLVESAGTYGGSLMFVAPGDTTTTLFAAGSSTVGLLQQDLFARSVSYQRGAYPLGSIEVMDVDTGAYRSYFTFDSSKNSGRQCTQTALNDKYLFWNYDPEGFYSANRETGEVRRLTQGLAECKRFCATPNGLVCTDGAVVFVDQETGAANKLVPSSALQADGACSVSRDRIAFVDYRDTPSSTSDDRSGGDIYFYDWASGGLTRVTTDAPALDLPKMLPMVDGPVVVWNQVPSTYAKVGPVSDIVSLFALTTTLAFKDLDTGKTCLYDASPIRGYVSVIGRRMYGYTMLAKGLYVAELNLDDPSIPWKCQ